MPVQKDPAILIVDDEKDLREVLSEICKAAFEEPKIVEAVNGADALVKLQRQKFDLMITDLQMPRSDGKALLENIRKLEERLQPSHILVVSGFIPQDISPELEGITCIAKPFEREVLLQHLRLVMAEAAKPVAKQVPISPKADAAFINHFAHAAVEVMSKTGTLQAERVSVYEPKPGEPSGDISATVQIDSRHYQGSFSIAFEEKCFLGVVEKMLGESVVTLNPEMECTVGELCNQIFGLAKRSLNSMGHGIGRAIPQVLRQKAHVVPHHVNGKRIAARFRTPAGIFVIEASIADKAA